MRQRPGVVAAALFLLVVVIPAALLAVAELGMRLAGYQPSGFLDFESPGPYGLYQANMDRVVYWGPIPYRITTNSYGMRSDEPVPDRPVILCIGQSVTDGFFVDTPDTWPEQLQKVLGQRGQAFSVLNASRGAAHFHEYQQRLRYFGPMFRPKYVVVQVSVSSITNTPVDDAVFDGDPTPGQADAGKRVSRAFARTALGEYILRRWFGVHIVRTEKATLKRSMDSERSVFEGGTKYAETARGDMKNLADEVRLVRGVELDSIFNRHSLSRRIEAADLYLKRMAEYSRSIGAELIVLYYPAYFEVYADAIGDRYPSFVSRHMREVVTKEAGATYVDAYDGIESMRYGSKPIHLAPLNLHPNRYYYHALGVQLADQVQRLQSRQGTARR